MKYFFFNLLWFLPLAISAQSNDILAAKALAQRVVPQYARRIVFEKTSDTSGKDVFELESVKGKVIIIGNSTNAMAVGLNYYLRNYCHADVSWYKKEGVQLPVMMPVVPHKIIKEARCSERFFFKLLHFRLHDALVAMERLAVVYR